MLGIDSNKTIVSAVVETRLIQWCIYDVVLEIQMAICCWRVSVCWCGLSYWPKIFSLTGFYEPQMYQMVRMRINVLTAFPLCITGDREMLLCMPKVIKHFTVIKLTFTCSLCNKFNLHLYVPGSKYHCLVRYNELQEKKKHSQPKLFRYVEFIMQVQTYCTT